MIALQDELAQRIVGLLVSRLTQTELARAQRKAPASLGAYDLFLRGRSVLASVDTSPVGEYGVRLLAARRTLDDAVQLDPGYAPALTALSGYLQPRVARRQRRAGARRRIPESLRQRPAAIPCRTSDCGRPHAC